MTLHGAKLLLGDHVVQARLKLTGGRAGGGDIASLLTTSEENVVLASLVGVVKGRDGGRIQGAVGLEGLNFHVGLHLPDFGAMVTGRGDHQGAVEIEVQVGDGMLVRVDGGQLVSGRKVPDDEGAFLMDGDQSGVGGSPLDTGGLVGAHLNFHDLLRKWKKIGK